MDTNGCTFEFYLISSVHSLALYVLAEGETKIEHMNASVLKESFKGHECWCIKGNF